MIISPAERTADVREYYFSTKNRQIAAMNADGRTEPVINLGIGAPNGRPPQEAIDALCEEAQKDGGHAYQDYRGTAELRKAFADWYARWYGVQLDFTTQVQPLVGSKEGILIVSLAFLNKGDKVLVPNPGYPTYSSSAALCQAEMLPYDLEESLGWQPDFEKLERMDLNGVKLMWTNYPGMPPGAPATPELFAKLVDFGRRHGILIVNDNPYSFVLSEKPLSILSAPGAFDCAIELNSLSKAHNMSGWRIGVVVGAAGYVSELLKVKRQMDSGMFRPMQIAATRALAQGPEWFESLNAEYRRRREAASKIMDLLGARYNPHSQGLFLWGYVGGDSLAKSDEILHKAGVFITPGDIFGSRGRGYLRISLCKNVPEYERAVQKIKAIL